MHNLTRETARESLAKSNNSPWLRNSPSTRHPSTGSNSGERGKMSVAVLGARAWWVGLGRAFVAPWISRCPLESVDRAGGAGQRAGRHSSEYARFVAGVRARWVGHLSNRHGAGRCRPGAGRRPRVRPCRYRSRVRLYLRDHHTILLMPGRTGGARGISKRAAQCRLPSECLAW